MFAPVPTPAEMADWDRAAAALGLPEEVLMENAARAAFAALRRHYGPLRGARVLLVMGGGNNGGDAACLARHLLDAGALPRVLHTRPLSAARGAARRYALLARRLGVPFAPARPERPAAWAWSPALSVSRAVSDIVPDIVVDGLLGTGFSGPLRPAEAAVAARINALAGAGSFILALDVPSGFDAGSGRAAPDAVRATLTVTFQAPKPGLLVPEAAAHTGRLEVCPIGIPAAARAAASYRLWRGPASAQSADATDVFTVSRGPDLPRPRRARRPDRAEAVASSGPAHEGEAGRVLVIGGSEGMSGAPRLAALGALRGGAGLVEAAVPVASMPEVRAELPEALTVALPRVGENHAAEWAARHVDLLAPALASARAAVVGPGMGRDNGAGDVLTALLGLPARPPLVLDADALYALAGRPDLLAGLGGRDVLTPHPGEAARLLGLSAADVQADRFGALAALAALAPAVWVLKGAGTLIACPGEASIIVPYNVPQLAVGGSGDVLAGLIGALLAAGQTAPDAACVGVHLHALAGLALAGPYPRRGNGPRDIAAALPGAWPLLETLSRGAERGPRPSCHSHTPRRGGGEPC